MRTLTSQQVTMLLASFPDTHAGRRDRLLTSLMVKLGLRISEATTLPADALTADGRLFVQRLKRRKVHVTEFPLPSGRLLAELQAWQADLAPDSVYLFPTLHGAAVHRVTLHNTIKQRADYCGFSAHPHLLRHTAITNLVQQRDKQGAPVYDLHTVQLLAGHANIATTSEYLHVNSENLRKQLKWIDT